ncbi:MAG: TRAP transporter substrate-binding protein [Rhizobiaceae bacterium]|nr:TRAP transporter substrate-binding protein [Rhizobiaceae bacterium]
MSGLFGIIGRLAATSALAASSTVMSHQLAAACDAPAHTFSLGLVQAPDVGHPSYAAALRFKEQVEANSECAVQIDLFPGGQLGGDREMFEAIVIGTQHIGFISPAPMSAFTSALDGLSLPWLFDGDLTLMHAALQGKPGETIRDAVDADTNTKSLSFIYSPFRDFVTTKPITGNDVLKGLKLRTMQSALNVATFAAIGTNPTPIPFPEVYGALQTGVVDGFETDVVGMYSGKFHEVAKHVTTSGHFNNVPLIVMNQAAWDGLEPQYQAVVQKAADDAGALSYERSLAQVEEYTQKLKDAGVTFHTVDIDALRKETLPVYTQFEEKSDVTRAFVEQVYAMKAAAKN